MQDYQQGRKTAGAFGQTAFNAPAQPTQPAGGIFGQQHTTASAPPTTGFGAFGNANPAPTNTFGAFGQPNNANTNSNTGAFGTFNQPPQNQQQPQPTTGFGAFGQPQQPQQNTGIFSNGGGAFAAAANNTQNKPFSGFGMLYYSRSVITTDIKRRSAKCFWQHWDGCLRPTVESATTSSCK